MENNIDVRQWITDTPPYYDKAGMDYLENREKELAAEKIVDDKKLVLTISKQWLFS